MRFGPAVFLALLLLSSTPCVASDTTETILQLVLNQTDIDAASNRLQRRLVDANAGELVIEEIRFPFSLVQTVPDSSAREERSWAKSTYRESSERSGTIRILPRIILGARAKSRCTPTIKGRVVLISTGQTPGQEVETAGTESLSELGAALGGIECYFANVNVTVQAEFGLMQNFGNPYRADESAGSMVFKNPSTPVANIGLGFAF